MTERGYNEKCSQDVIDAEWAALPQEFSVVLSPYRSDAHGLPAIEFILVGDLREVMDIKLVCNATGTVEGAKRYVASEIRAAQERIAFVADKRATELIAGL